MDFAKNFAGALVLSFIGFVAGSPAAQKEGTKRRLAREQASGKARSALYLDTPRDHAISRQMRRATFRGDAKAAARRSNWTWREVFAAIASVRAV